jgi:hypothetical protein
MKRLLFTLAVMMVVSSASVYAQQVSPKRPEIDPKTTEAYSLLIQRKVKLQAQLETFVSENSSEWPPAKRLQFELDSLKIEMKKMSEVDESKVSKLTSGYGGLILRKVWLTGEMQFLSQDESPEWPSVKEKQRELELLDKEIQKIMK